MNTIDFSHPGGFPLTQDELDFLQQAYIECISALGSVVNTSAVCLSGMVASTGFGGYTTYSPGYFMYNGVIYHFTGGATGAIMFPSVPLVVIQDTPTNLTYYDTSVFPALHVKTATLMIGTSTTTATVFPLSDMLPYRVALGLAGRDSTFINISSTISAGGVVSNIYYKKNYITNTVHLYGTSASIAPWTFTAAPPAVNNTVIATLPVDCKPVSAAATFTATLAPGTSLQQDSAGNYFSSLNGFLETTGKISLDFFQMSLSMSVGVEWNVVLPLD